MADGIGKRLKDARKRAHIYQADAAKAMKMSRPTLSAIENDKREVTAGEIQKFSELYHVSVSHIITGEDDIMADRLRSYQETFDRITREYQDRISEVLRKMKEEQ